MATSKVDPELHQAIILLPLECVTVIRFLGSAHALPYPHTTRLIHKEIQD